MRFLLILIALVIAFPVAAQRQKSVVPELDAEGHKGDMARAVQKKANQRFDKADENKDGVIVRDEALKHLPHVGANFEKYDQDGDGKLSWVEYIGHDKWKREPAK